MRKAGGSTVRGFLEKVYADKRVIQTINSTIPLSPDTNNNNNNNNNNMGVYATTTAATALSSSSSSGGGGGGIIISDSFNNLTVGGGGGKYGRKRKFKKKGDTRSWTSHTNYSLLKGVTLRHQEFDLFPLKCLVTTPATV
jgi:hypothetical protein